MENSILNTREEALTFDAVFCKLRVVSYEVKQLLSEMPTIKRYLVFLATSSVIGTANVMAEPADADHSESPNDIASQQKTADVELRNALSGALSKMPRIDKFDIRKSQGQLLKAESAWERFRNENCRYVGGQKAGANNWVSKQVDECILDETRARIKFLLTSHSN